MLLNAFSKELSLNLVLGNSTIVTSHDEKSMAVQVTAASKPTVAGTQLYAIPASSMKFKMTFYVPLAVLVEKIEHYIGSHHRYVNMLVKD